MKLSTKTLSSAILVLCSFPLASVAQTLKPAASDYVIDFDLPYAMFSGKSEDGKSISRIALEMEGKMIFIKDIFVYGYGEQTGKYTVVIGDNTPRLFCEQTSKEKRLHAMDNTAKGSYAVRGKYVAYVGGKFTLAECDFEKLKN